VKHPPSHRLTGIPHSLKICKNRHCDSFPANQYMPTWYFRRICTPMPQDLEWDEAPSHFRAQWQIHSAPTQPDSSVPSNEPATQPGCLCQITAGEETVCALPQLLSRG
jgi:hypothetical protein